MIDAKIRLTAQFSEAIRALEGLAAEFKAVQAQAQGMNSGAATEGLTNGLQEAKAQAKETAATVRSVGEAAAKAGAEGQALAQGLNQGLDQAQAKAQQATKQTQALGQAASVASQAGAKAQAAARGVADETAKGLKASENQMRMLGPQLTDIAVGLSTGQSPLMVLLQQGGQLKDIFGGIGGALRALSSVITPLTMIGAGLATLAVAAYQSYQNSDALNKALALTGNVAGQTSGQLTLLAQQLAQSQNASIGASKEALAAAVATGAFGAQTLASAGKAALALSKLTGQSADEIVKDFAQMSGGVTEWATKSDAAINFLSLAQLRLVRDLEATGQKQEAMRVVLEALNTTITQRSVPALNAFGKALNSVGNAGSGFWDWVKNLTHADTVEEKLAKLSQRMEELKARRDNLNASKPYRQAASEDLAKAEKEFAALEALRQAGAKSAEEEAKQREKDQDGKIKDRKDYQAALAQVDQAGAQYLLAQQLAAIDEAQGNLDVAHAKGLLSEEQYGLRQNAIELKRLEAQKATTERRIELARSASEKIESPIEKMGAQAAVKQLESELVAIQGRIKQAATQGRAISADAALNDDRERANNWLQLWQQAFTQVRQFANANAATDASRLTDPIKAAEAVALARVESARQQLKDLQDGMDREVGLLKGAANKAESPDKRDAFNAQAASLQAKRDELTLTAKLAIDEQTRLAQQTELKNSLGVATEALKIKEEELTQSVQQGVTTTTDGEARKFAARRAAIPQLEAILAALEAIAKTPEELNAVAGWKQKIRELKNETGELQMAMRDSIKGGFSQLFSDVATGAKSAGDAFKDFVSGVAKSMLDLIAKRLGEQLMNSMMGASSGGSAGWIGAAASFIYDAFSHHTGGVVGQAGMPMRVPVAAFAGAPRYHSGGIAGLKPNERPAVLLDGEEVLTANDPRHVRNLKSRSSSGVQVGDITVNVTTQGTGTQTGDKDLGKRLGDGIKSVVYSILVNESREGGLLAKGAK